MKVIIAPYSAKLRTSPRNPKDYPWWRQVVRSLNEHGHEVIQIGVSGESRIDGVAQFVTNWPLDKLAELARECDTWASVDSFFPHLCYRYGLKSGVVVWGQSDPLIFGHPENTNLLKDAKYLRPTQFAHWEDVPYNEAAFVLPEIVTNAILAKLDIAGAISAR